jgi:hypothetical protein
MGLAIVPRQYGQKQRAQHINFLRGIIAGVVQWTVFHPRIKAMPQFEKLDKKRKLPYWRDSRCWIPFYMAFPSKGLNFDGFRY